jgi:hypothetical protein
LSAQIASSDAYLFRPQLATRVRRNVNTDTPLPPEEPVGQNPPDGAIIDYYLKSAPTTPVVLEILDATGQVVRRFASNDQPEQTNERDYNVPTYWFQPPRVLPATAGMQRFVWDLHYPRPRTQRYDYPISAIYRDTPREPLGTLVEPGRYTVRLNVNGKSYTQPLNVRIDPRVKTPPLGLHQQFTLAMRAYDGMNRSYAALEEVRALRAQVKDLRAKVGQGPLGETLARFDGRLLALEGAGGGPAQGPPGAAAANDLSLARLNGDWNTLFGILQEADATPTTQAARTADELQARHNKVLGAWAEIKSTELNALNAQLRQANLPALTLEQ